ncbi:MAG: OmpA family protein [Gammaproteobacteria bacterium]|nr:OmpA family protein [Gammaproteobacteria bacterium]MDE0412157.1 OmpA family protein [Gammaproteobacteria bacterium]
MIKRLLISVLWAGVLMVLGGCGTHTQQMVESPGTQDQKDSAVSASGEDASGISGMASEDGLAIEKLEDQDASSGTPGTSGAAGSGEFADLGKIIYFDYNSSDIRDEFLPIITHMVSVLETNPGMRVRLEGHADERGTREYNLALGERRAQEVRERILLQGILEDRVDIVSFGEEKPAAMGTGDEIWQQNRRVELVY